METVELQPFLRSFAYQSRCQCGGVFAVSLAAMVTLAAPALTVAGPHACCRWCALCAKCSATSCWSSTTWSCMNSRLVGIGAVAQTVTHCLPHLATLHVPVPNAS